MIRAAFITENYYTIEIIDIVGDDTLAIRDLIFDNGIGYTTKVTVGQRFDFTCDAHGEGSPQFPNLLADQIANTVVPGSGHFSGRVVVTGHTGNGRIGGLDDDDLLLFAQTLGAPQ